MIGASLSMKINWKAVYKNNILAAIKTKLRPFQTTLTFRAIVMNRQSHGFGLIDNSSCTLQN